MSIYRFKISLKEIRPPIWRRIEVCGNHTLNDLHLMFQAVMGWHNCHLHMFKIDNIHLTDFFDDDQRLNEFDDRDFTIEQVLGDKVKKFIYEYDFGDGWEHQIDVEKIIPPDFNIKYPICIAGRRACPPEDCGSYPGYYRCLEALKDPFNNENQELIEWMGHYDPEHFDIKKTNERLQLWKNMIVFD
jgi:hypothetical protein